MESDQNFSSGLNSGFSFKILKKTYKELKQYNKHIVIKK